MKMERLLHTSTAHEKLYDPTTKRLSVRFKVGGPIYHYDGVTQEAHDALMAAPSFGAHFAMKVRGKYPFTKEVREERKHAA